MWIARALAIGVSLFLAIFALDAWDPGRRLGERLAEVAIHLIPSALVLTIVAAAWRRPWIGGASFLGLAVAYAVSVDFRPDWILAISGPLLIVGLLYLWPRRKKGTVTFSLSC
ncbi:MAG TPA: hypothetical protein VGD94_08030 [Vicinamibacterales bacterium]